MFLVGGYQMSVHRREEKNFLTVNREPSLVSYLVPPGPLKEKCDHATMTPLSNFLSSNTAVCLSRGPAHSPDGSEIFVNIRK